MGNRRVQTEAEAIALVNVIKTKRSKELELLQSYFENTQYEQRPSYFDQDSGVPRLERRPCIVYGVVGSAVETNTAMALGGERFPRVLSQVNEDDSIFDASFGLNKDDSAVIDQFNAKLIELCGFTLAFRNAFRHAQAARSVAVIGCYRNGYPQLDCVWSKLCTPTFSPSDPCKVVTLEIRYRYIDWQLDPALSKDGAPIPVVKEYRRVIDAKSDTVFVEKEVWDKSDVAPSTAADTVITHNLGFCPVVWYARQRQSYAVGGYDGKAIHEGKLGELDAVNHALSSRHLAALYAGDPILFGSGIDPEETLGRVGRGADARAIDPSASPTQWDRALYNQSGAVAIKKSPGDIWRVESPDAKLNYITLPPQALDAVSAHAEDLCTKLREALRYVWLDPTTLTGSGDISGKTLAFVFQTQVLSVTDDREDFGRGCLIPCLGMLYRMLVKSNTGVFVPGLKKALPILKRFLVQQASGGETFFVPHLQLKWGDIFPPSDVDQMTRISTAVQALTSSPPLITQQVAVEAVREVFGIADVSAHMDSLQKETDQRQQQAMANATAMSKATTPTDPKGAAMAPLPPNAQSKNRGLKSKDKSK